MASIAAGGNIHGLMVFVHQRRAEAAILEKRQDGGAKALLPPSRDCCDRGIVSPR